MASVQSRSAIRNNCRRRLHSRRGKRIAVVVAAAEADVEAVLAEGGEDPTFASFAVFLLRLDSTTSSFSSGCGGGAEDEEEDDSREGDGDWDGRITAVVPAASLSNAAARLPYNAATSAPAFRRSSDGDGNDDDDDGGTAVA